MGDGCHAYSVEEETDACLDALPVCSRAWIGGQVVVSPARVLPVAEEPTRG